MKTMMMAAVLAAGVTGMAQAAQGPIQGPVLDDAMVAHVVAKAQQGLDAAKLSGCIAVVGETGALVYLHRPMAATPGCVDASIGKARTSALYHAPSVVFMDRLAKGETTVMAIPHAVPLGGGYPLKIAGTVVGAVGISTPKQDVDNTVSQAAAGAVE